MRNISKVSRRKICSLAVAAVSGLAVSHAIGQTNIIQNGGFEQGSGTSIPDWNTFDPTTTIDTTFPYDGLQDLYIDNTQAGYAQYVYQDTPAGSVTPGDVYTFSFYAAGTFSPGGIGQYQVSFFGANGPIQFGGVQVIFPGTAYSQYPAAGSNTYTAPAGATYAEVQLWATTGANPGTNSAQMHVDDVSLTTPSSAGGGGSSAWAIAGSGDWNVGSNWTAGSPNAIDAEADFFGSITSANTVYTNIPVTLGTINFNNSNTYVISGAGSLTMKTSTGSANVIVQAGTQKIDLPFTIASNTNLNVSSGATLLISNPMEIESGISVSTIGSGTVTYQSTVTIDPGGSLALAGPTTAFSLSLLGNASASTSTSGARSLIQFDNLSLSGTSSFNLADNDMIVHGGNLATVTAELASGYNGGQWNGTGISSSAAAADSTHLTALGVIQTASAGTFDGAAVAAGDVLVKYTYYGDANLDGKVDASDYSLIDNGYLNQLTGWGNGDFNYDGVVNGSDYTLIDNAFNEQGAGISAASEIASSTDQLAGTAAVPEPGVMSLLLVGATTLLRRRRVT